MPPMCREVGWEWTVLDGAFEWGYLSQTYIPNPIPILECFSGILLFPVSRLSVFSVSGFPVSGVPRTFLRVAPV